jgi:hypothetical protein
MLKCTISAAGGISHLLKLGPAVILSLDKKPLMTIPLFLPYDSQDVSLMPILCQRPFLVLSV